jgi:hypothetical protein
MKNKLFVTLMMVSGVVLASDKIKVGKEPAELSALQIASESQKCQYENKQAKIHYYLKDTPTGQILVPIEVYCRPLALNTNNLFYQNITSTRR